MNEKAHSTPDHGGPLIRPLAAGDGRYGIPLRDELLLARPLAGR